MPITKTVTVYSFEELSPESQERAIDHFSDINVYHGWWEFVYEDAANIGIDITDFDDYRCSGKMTKYFLDVIRLIKTNFAENVEVFKTACVHHGIFIDSFIEFCRVNPDGLSRLELLEEFKDSDIFYSIEKQFLSDILEDYRILLMKEYDYLTGLEQIKEAIIVNEYKFNENGTIF
jgi:hypothetical protein